MYISSLTSTEDQIRLWPHEQPDDHGHVGDHVQTRDKDPECQDQDQMLPVKLSHDLLTEDGSKEPEFYIVEHISLTINGGNLV